MSQKITWDIFKKVKELKVKKRSQKGFHAGQDTILFNPDWASSVKEVLRKVVSDSSGEVYSITHALFILFNEYFFDPVAVGDRGRIQLSVNSRQDFFDCVHVPGSKHSFELVVRPDTFERALIAVPALKESFNKIPNGPDVLVDLFKFMEFLEKSYGRHVDKALTIADDRFW